MEVSIKLQSRIIESACGPYQIPSQLHMILSFDQLALLRVPQGKRFTMYCSRREPLAIQSGLRCTGLLAPLSRLMINPPMPTLTGVLVCRRDGQSRYVAT